MKILWVADFTVKEHKGGAQQTNDVMIKAGRKKGHSISVYTNGELPKSLDSYDRIIINNITKYSDKDIKRLTDTGKCIRYEHDYWVAENYPQAYQHCVDNIFLSPLHKETVEKKIGYEIRNFHLVPSPIDSKLFKIDGEKEKRTVIWVGNICEEKGSKGFIEYAIENPNYKFYVIGWGADIDKMKELDNIEVIEQMEIQDLVKYYQKCEFFYHRPDWSEPFGRSVIEAYLCGCNLLVNDNVGAISWDWDFSNYKEIQKKVQSQSNFWKVIEDEIQTSRDME